MTDFVRRLLIDDLAVAQRRHPNYSMRAYARALGVSPTSLSLYLRGKRGLSADALERVSKRLGVRLPSATEPTAEPRHTLYREVDLETMRAISDWYYFAILSLAEIPDFSADPEWIGARLNIPTGVAREALATLIKLGLLVRRADGRVEGTGVQLKTPDQLTSALVRRSHLQSLDLAQSSLEYDPVEIRNFSAMTMAIDPDLLPEAARRIRRFRRSLSAFLESGTKREVYRLAIQLFPLSKEVPSREDVD